MLSRQSCRRSTAYESLGSDHNPDKKYESFHFRRIYKTIHVLSECTLIILSIYFPAPPLKSASFSAYIHFLYNTRKVLNVFASDGSDVRNRTEN